MNSMLHSPTASEAALWEALRGGALGVAFKRQVPRVTATSRTSRRRPCGSWWRCLDAPAGRRPRRVAPAGAPTTPKPVARPVLAPCSASPARGACARGLRGQVGVVVIGLLAPMWVQAVGARTSIVRRWALSFLRCPPALGVRPSFARGRTLRASAGVLSRFTVGRCHVLDAANSGCAAWVYS